MLNQPENYGAETPKSATSLLLSLCLILTQAAQQCEASRTALLEG
jgi:hypothetical protein